MTSRCVQTTFSVDLQSCLLQIASNRSIESAADAHSINSEEMSAFIADCTLKPSSGTSLGVDDVPLDADDTDGGGDCDDEAAIEDIETSVKAETIVASTRISNHTTVDAETPKATTAK